MKSILDAGLYVVWHNNQWNRAILMFREGVSSPESIELYLLDLGQYIVAPLSHIRKATVDLIDYPIFAVRCQLADLHSSYDFQPVMAILQVRGDDYFSVEVVYKDVPVSGGCLINRIRLFNIFCENLAQKCTNDTPNRYSESTTPPEHNGNGALTASTSSAQMQTSSTDPLHLSNILTERMKNCALEANTSSAQLKGTSQNVAMSSIDYGIDVRRPLLQMEIPSTEFRAFVVFAPDPSDFTIQLECAQNVSELIKQMTETEEFMSKSPIENEPIPGRYYLAKVDDLWHRVFVGENPRVKQTDKYRVFLVDSGYIELVQIENIKEMMLPLYEPQMMAVKCQLFGVKPTPRSNYWCGEAHTAFFTRVIDDASDGIIVHVKGEPGFWNERFAPELPKVKADSF